MEYLSILMIEQNRFNIFQQDHLLLWDNNINPQCLIHSSKPLYSNEECVSSSSSLKTKLLPKISTVVIHH